MVRIAPSRHCWSGADFFTTDYLSTDLSAELFRSSPMNRHSSALIDSTPDTSSIGSPSPRTIAAGTPSSASPMTSSAADAMLSATARLVTSSFRPKRSLRPRSSITDTMPAHPMATPLQPARIACVRLSAMITATFAPHRRLIYPLILSAPAPAPRAPAPRRTASGS